MVLHCNLYVRSVAIYMDIGNRIREFRQLRHLSQQELADSADVERSYLTHLENGKKNISVDTLEKILNSLDISFREFFNDEKFEKI
jgi:transcriptional regulator with XRE-family HTH domain